MIYRPHMFFFFLLYKYLLLILRPNLLLLLVYTACLIKISSRDLLHSPFTSEIAKFPLDRIVRSRTKRDSANLLVSDVSYPRANGTLLLLRCVLASFLSFSPSIPFLSYAILYFLSLSLRLNRRNPTNRVQDYCRLDLGNS